MREFLRRLRKPFVLAICVFTLCASYTPALAETEAEIIHENPETAPLEFSGISLFQYYSGSLDLILQKDAPGTEARLQKMPFVNIPESLAGPAGVFADKGTALAWQVTDIDGEHNTLRELMAQSRFEEALGLADRIADTLSQAYTNLDSIRASTVASGEEFNVTSGQRNELSRSYDGVLTRIEQIAEMLDRYKNLTTDILLGLETIFEKQLTPTGLTLEINPAAAFVGEEIHFQGRLTSPDGPLAGQEITILLNQSEQAISTTDTDGYYQGTLLLPYWYTPLVTAQALYYPRGQDTGLYLSSLSPEMTLNILFYEGSLALTGEDEAYPGRETGIDGSFSYGDSPPAGVREIEFYLDNNFAGSSTVTANFQEEFPVPPPTETGIHLLTIAAPAAGRYAPVTASASLKIIRAVPVVDMELPRIVLMPGSIPLSGRVYSPVGPASTADVKIRLGGAETGFVTSTTGTFNIRLQTGMEFVPIGSQDMQIQVIPHEPWHAVSSTTRNIVMINMASSGILLIILIGLGFLAQSRLRQKRKAARSAPRTGSVTEAPQPAFAHSPTAIISTKGGEIPREPRGKIFYLYRQAVRLIQSVTGALFSPQQTLREFLRENRSLLGPAARFFEGLTNMTERLLYSGYQPTEQDTTASEHAYHDMEKEIKK